jgi:DMSO/TMAO reductase YedYZ molybdopterin-dependent catalytic subunit
MKKDILYSDAKIRRKTFISFGVFVGLSAVATRGWFYLKNLPPDHGLLGGVQEPVRKVLDFNEKVFNKSLSQQHLAKTYPLSEAVKTPRVNGEIGLADAPDAAAWELSVTKAGGDTLTLRLEDIKKLPKTEIIFNFKCIEGWSQVTHWGGVTFSDFAAAYHLEKETAMQYVGMSTPDYEYYVGIDMPSALHPQTLLCYEMNGLPLSPEHGAPLRMIIPVKYGVKSLKRIGSIYFDNARPADYWFERGYDYYSGL